MIEFLGVICMAMAVWSGMFAMFAVRDARFAKYMVDRRGHRRFAVVCAAVFVLATYGAARLLGCSSF